MIYIKKLKMNKNPLSILIITKNEEDNLKELLPTLDFANEIVIVDSHSSDKTIQIAKQFTDKVFTNSFESHAKQKNWGLNKTTNKWVFIIDADERITSKLSNELVQTIQKESNIVAYWIKRTNLFMDKYIKYSGWQSDKVIRLINTEFCQYNNALIHEEIDAKGKVGTLKNKLKHNTYKDFASYLDKINEYTSKKAIQRYEKGKRYSMSGFLIKPFFKFISRYFFKLGILDGKQGLIISILTAHNVFLTNVKLFRLQNGEKLS